MGRASQLAIAAARLALKDAGLSPETLPADKVGVSIGTTSGEPTLIEQFDDAEVAGKREAIGREFIEQYPSHVIAAHVAAELGFGGPNIVIPTACAAGNYALANACDTLRDEGRGRDARGRLGLLFAHHLHRLRAARRDRARSAASRSTRTARA